MVYVSVHILRFSQQHNLEPLYTPLGRHDGASSWQSQLHVQGIVHLICRNGKNHCLIVAEEVAAIHFVSAPEARLRYRHLPG